MKFQHFLPDFFLPFPTSRQKSLNQVEEMIPSDSIA
jgi:hypothetical protein